MRHTVLIGGPAGAGPNFVANLLSRTLLEKGFFVFTSREYESRIRGGHNFNLVTFSDSPVYSNSTEISILVALDEPAYELHKKEITSSTIAIKGNSNNVFEAAQLHKILGIEFSILDAQLKKAAKYEENIKIAHEAYHAETRSLLLPSLKRKKEYLMNGAEGTAIGAVKSGLEFYYAYPMTPATTLLFELTARQSASSHKNVELESEIAVINGAAGSALTGAKTMIGTSGGGFDLMTEAFSMLGITEIPLVVYLAQRLGPGTGGATYQSQGDLLLALHAGHGEFPRLVVAPGDPLESIEKTSELFYLTQKYKMAGILLTDRHLAESSYTLTADPKITKSPKTVKWPGRYSSYESDSEHSSTGDPIIIKKNIEARIEKGKKLAQEVEKLETYKIHGDKSSDTLIISWGSTKGAILDAISSGIKARFLQILYLEPFSDKLVSEIKKAKNIIVVENNSTSPLSSLIAEKCLIQVQDKNKVLRYDGRPFLGDELAKELKRLI